MRWTPSHLTTILAQAKSQGSLQLTCASPEAARSLRFALYRHPDWRAEFTAALGPDPSQLTLTYSPGILFIELPTPQKETP